MKYSIFYGDPEQRECELFMGGLATKAQAESVREALDDLVCTIHDRLGGEGDPKIEVWLEEHV